MPNNYDIIVIGAGSAGLSVSLSMHKLGFKVLLVDRSDKHIGGECLNDGCVPSKALIHVARILHRGENAQKFGLKLEGAAYIKNVMKYIQVSQDIIRAHENTAYFQKQGLDVVLGEARFESKNQVIVNEKIYTAKKIVVATGSRPAKLKVPGVELVKYYDNESIFEINDLPKKFLVIGGGPVGIEMAQAFQRLGSKVTIVQRGDRILKNDDLEATKILHEQLEREDIVILLNAQVIRFTSSTQATISINASTRPIDFDAIFVAAGRRFTTEGLQLQKGGIAPDGEGIKVDNYLRTTNKNVYACGDIAGSLKFSHAAEHHARIILNNLFSPFKKRLNNDHLSWVTFTDPEVATFGLSEDALKKRKISYKRLQTSFADDDRAVVDSYRNGKLILFISHGGAFTKQRILGGTMVAPHAGEMIQELILANSQKISINAIFNKIYPYPVGSRINQKIIVDYKLETLTEGIKKLLRIAFKLFS